MRRINIVDGYCGKAARRCERGRQDDTGHLFLQLSVSNDNSPLKDKGGDETFASFVSGGSRSGTQSLEKGDEGGEFGSSEWRHGSPADRQDRLIQFGEKC